VAPAERLATAMILAAKDRDIQKKFPHKTMLEAAAVPAA
jgi:hypothetical protein